MTRHHTRDARTGERGSRHIWFVAFSKRGFLMFLFVWTCAVIMSIPLCRGARDWFGMLPGSSYPSILHSFRFIDPGWITSLAPSIKHIIFDYARKFATRVANRTLRYDFDHMITFLRFRPTQRKQYTTKRRGHTDLLQVHITQLWC